MPPSGYGKNRRRRRAGILVVLAVAAGLPLAGCASDVDNQMPVGIGTGVNTLKRSPCACVELPNEARALS